MKSNAILILLVVVVILLTGCTSKNNQLTEEIDFESISVEKINIKNLMDFGKIQKVIKLETNNDSAFGYVEAIRFGPTGDIYICDKSSVKKILRFGEDGHFITRYGRVGQGPGEYNQLFGFDVVSDGSVVLLSDAKLIKYDKSGKPVKEIRLKFRGWDLAVIGEHIYISVSGYRHAVKNKAAIEVLNLHTFETVGAIGKLDTRVEKYAFLPRNVQTEYKNSLCYIDFYDLRFRIFNLESKQTLQLTLPNDNVALNPVWEKKNFQEKDRTHIKKFIHRFEFAHASGNGLFLNEFRGNKMIDNYWFIDLDAKKARVFLNPEPESRKEELFISYMAGAYDNGIVAVLDNDTSFNKHKMKFPALKDIEFGMEDNPLLVLFEIKDY